VFCQKIFNSIYQIFSFLKILESTDGILIFALVTLIFSNSFSPALIIFNLTFVPAGHFILSTASYKLKSFKSILFAFNIISFSFI
jgi:hypothetical protein